MVVCVASSFIIIFSVAFARTEQCGQTVVRLF
jgi:hypothetical protein